MALTEEQKRKIEEEEVYREKAREESKSNKKGRSGCLVAVLVIVGLFAFTLIAINPAKQFETAEKNAQNAPALKSDRGSFTTPTGENYSFEITFEEEERRENKYVASYTPFLKNHDATLMMAIFEAFK